MVWNCIGFHLKTCCPVVLMAALFCSGTVLAGDEDVRLRIQDTVAFAGGEVDVSVSMNASPRPSSIAFWIEYDESKLTFLEAEPGIVLTLAGKDVSWDFPAPGRVSFLIFGVNDLRIASGKILTLRFDVDADVESSEDLLVQGLNQSASDPDANRLETIIEGGAIDILACFRPAQPANFSATDGLFPGYVQLTWTPVFGAQSYVIYRSDVNDPATATLVASTLLPFYSDTSAQGANVTGSGGGGCSGGPGQSVDFSMYYYWVLSQNICGQSSLTPSESGYRGNLKAANTTRVAVDFGSSSKTELQSKPEITVADLTEDGIPDFQESVGQAYNIFPVGQFASAFTVRVPVPADVEPSELIPYFYVREKGWYPAPNVDGWLEPGTLTVTGADGDQVIEFGVHHGGMVRLGYIVQPRIAAGIGPFSGATPLALVGLALAVMSRARQRAGGR
ncbi:MAG: cohesin domain-containing protein [Candidatus Hydrogenedentes bacterium]|nr:cohesin domain-containing protein [Candidatus Hydrogenedentota bacterium]